MPIKCYFLMSSGKKYSKVIKKKYVNRFLRFLPYLGCSSNKKINGRVRRRGVLEKFFLWRWVFDSWLPELVGGMFRQPFHQNIWTWPMLNRYDKIWITFLSSAGFRNSMFDLWKLFWFPLTGEDFRSWVRLWCYNRLLLFSVFFAVFFAFFVFILIVYFFFLVFSTLNYFLIFLSYTVWSIDFFYSAIFSIILFFLPFCFIFFYRFVPLRCFKYPSVYPRWDVCALVARPRLAFSLKIINSVQRVKTRSHYFFSWFGCLERSYFHSSTNLRNFHHLYGLNAPYWEKKIRYHKKGVWHYNVTYDFWFDYYYNYPSFSGCAHSLRDLSLEVHPFLFVRSVMTSSALRPLRWNRSRDYFLFHYAENQFLWFFGRLTLWFGKTVLYHFRRFRLFFFFFIHRFVGCFNFKKLNFYQSFYDYNTYFSHPYLSPVYKFSPRLVFFFMLFFATLTAANAQSAGRFFYLTVERNFFSVSLERNKRFLVLFPNFFSTAIFFYFSNLFVFKKLHNHYFIFLRFLLLEELQFHYFIDIKVVSTKFFFNPPVAARYVNYFVFFPTFIFFAAGRTANRKFNFFSQFLFFQVPK